MGFEPLISEKEALGTREAGLGHPKPPPLRAWSCAATCASRECRAMKSSTLKRRGGDARGPCAVLRGGEGLGKEGEGLGRGGVGAGRGWVGEGLGGGGLGGRLG